MKIDLFILHPDNTHSRKRCKVNEGRAEVPSGFMGIKKKDWKPRLSAGLSVFPERATSIWQKLGLKRKQRLALVVEGSPFCFELDPRDGLLDDHWTFAEARKFIAKLVSLAASKQKIFSNWQVLLLFGGMGIVMILEYLIIRRIGL